MKLLDRYKNLYITLLIVLPLFFSIFADASLFSIFINNLIPVRLVLVALNLLGVLYIFKKRLNIKSVFKDGLFISLSAFILFSFLSYFYTPDLKTYFSMIAFYVNLLIFYAVLSVFSKKIKTKLNIFESTFYYLLVFINSLSLVIGLRTYYLLLYGGYWGPVRVVSTITDENHYAMFLVIGIFVTLYFIFTKYQNHSWLNYLLLFFSVVLLSATKSRSGFLALFAGITIYFTISLWKHLFSLKKLTLTLTFLFLAIVFGFYIFKPFTTTGVVRYTNDLTQKEVHTPTYTLIKTPYKFSYFDKYVENLLPDSLSGASIKAHLALIYSSIVMGIKHPVFGVGVGGFNDTLVNSNLIELYARYDPQAATSKNFPAHSMYGKAFGEGGFIGLFLYLAILFYMGKKYWFNFKHAKDYNNKVLALSFISIFGGFLVFSIFYNVHEEWFWVPAFLGLIIVKTSK